MTDKNKKIKGIDGWLSFFMLMLFLGAVVWSIKFIFKGWLLSSEESGIYEVMIFLISMVLAFLVIYSLVLGFKEKKEFPIWAIVFLWAEVFATIILSFFDNNYSDVFLATIWAIIWTWYLKVSVRVKNTFVK